MENQKASTTFLVNFNFEKKMWQFANGTFKRILNHKKEIIIMHPGPINRGVEIDSVVADSDQAIILDQVLNGVASRMAILYLFCGESPGKDTK